MALDLLVRNTSEVLTVRGGPRETPERMLGAIVGGCVGVSAGRIEFLGSEEQLPSGAVAPTTNVLDARGGFVGPGLVDPHTHLVFAGERAGEFDLRNRGASYLELARAGGGIMSTVRATRAASEDELVELALPRLRNLLEQGVTTAEVKSGYGLNLADELKILRAIRRLSSRQPVRLIPTLLCAHSVPEEFRQDRDGYLRLCIEEILPAVASEKLAHFCDVFVEESAFRPDEARRLLEAARGLGMLPRLHVDQLTAADGAVLAAELGALTADHLEQISPRGISALSAAGVSAVLIPTSTLFVRARPFAPGRALRDAGVNVALATNVNPGSAMTENVSLALGLGCLENGLSAAEAYYGFTRGAAIALGLESAGTLELGGPADLVLYRCPSYQHLPYRLGMNEVAVVIKAGRIVVDSARPLPG